MERYDSEERNIYSSRWPSGMKLPAEPPQNGVHYSSHWDHSQHRHCNGPRGPPSSHSQQEDFIDGRCKVRKRLGAAGVPEVWGKSPLHAEQDSDLDWIEKPNSGSSGYDTDSSDSETRKKKRKKSKKKKAKDKKEKRKKHKKKKVSSSRARGDSSSSAADEEEWEEVVLNDKMDEEEKNMIKQLIMEKNKKKAAEVQKQEEVIGPTLEEDDGDNKDAPLDYGKALLPGEGAAMAAYITEGKRIPRRGEIGLTSEQIVAYEDIGYVMSGSRHRRMEAVRLRKENQVYSADEKRALANFNHAERAKREKQIMAQFKELVMKKKQTQGGE